MLVEIWSDVVCPWCYIGKRQFEQALATFAHRDDVTVEWRSFELDPTAPKRLEMPMAELLSKKYGMSQDEARAANTRISGIAAGVGLQYRLDDAQMGNTFDAHRLIHLAATRGVADAMKERLMAAYFTEGAPIGELPTLVQLATEVGLDAGEVEAALAGDDFADEVRADEQRAGQLGISGVPFFVIDQAYGVSGAQPSEVLAGALQQAWDESHPPAEAALR
jgi:predicted DsbA family dithiol-disulfide isomerase